MSSIWNRRLGWGALCTLAGVLTFLATADFDIWPLAWLCQVPLLFVVLDERCEHPFRWGWLAGLVTNAGGFYWIDHLLVKFGHLPQVAALPLYLLLVGYQGLAFAFFAWILHHLARRIALPVTLLAPMTLAAVELLFPLVFPWYLAITQAWQPAIIQVADFSGPIGVSFLLMTVNAALYEVLLAWRRKQALPWRPPAAAALVLLFSLVYGQLRIRQVEAQRAAAPHVKVGLVQANIGIDEKWLPGLREDHLALHQRLSAELERQGAELIVWPESSYPYVFHRRQTRDFPLNDGRRVQRGFQTPILFGTVTVGEDSPYPYNSALMMDAEGHLQGRFDKNFLLVFGEYIPYYEQLQWVRKLIPEMSNFGRGTGVTTFPYRNWRLGPMICYEDIIPAFGRRLVAEHPNLLVNITNDAWFGATSEPYEHMALSVFRAVEHRLDMVRAVNTGTSVFISATGRVYQKTQAVDPDETPGVQPVTVLDQVAMLEASGPYGRLGDLFGGLNLLGVLVLGILAIGRSGRRLAWKEVGLGGVIVAAGTLLGAVVAAGPSELAEAVREVVRLPGASEGVSVVTVGLVLGGAAGCLAAGVLLGRRAKSAGMARPALEAGVAALAVLLAPALLLGRTEGATASLVFGSAGALLCTRLGLRLAGRSAAAAPSDEAAAESPPTEAEGKPTRRGRQQRRR
ncbi:MAG TPA: apolipoprotein N-acyltransferase [Polyangia bacterium]|nr:apolipoprotein N-acyltransferase [Polyangia bacterium]